MTSICELMKKSVASLLEWEVGAWLLASAGLALVLMLGNLVWSELASRGARLPHGRRPAP